MQPITRPEFSRRQMLAVAGAVAAAPAFTGVALPSWFGRWSSAASAATLDDLTLDRFVPHVGSRFTITTRTSGRVPVMLEEATAVGPHPADRPGVTGDAFSLVFRAKGPTRLVDGTYALGHPALGSVAIFVVAVGPTQGRQAYQAVVDRRVPAR